MSSEDSTAEYKTAQQGKVEIKHASKKKINEKDYTWKERNLVKVIFNAFVTTAGVDLMIFMRWAKY